MVTPFEFLTAGRIVFGAGKLRELPGAARQHGDRALVVCGSRERARGLLESLEGAGVATTVFSMAGEPTVERVNEGAERARAAGAKVVIGFGGGSALDGAKAIAALATNPGGALEYLEVIGKGRPLTEAPLPTIAIPTTAGSGAEVTKNAVIASPEHRFKASLRHEWLVPRLAIVDPETTHSLPASTTASTGMDALTQLIEPFVSARSNPLVDALCRDGIRRASSALPYACADGGHGEARCHMAFASLLGGMALANAGLGAVHGFAAPIGGMYRVPHGEVCAALLPAVMMMNVRVAIQTREYRTIERYADVARLVTGDRNATIEEGIDHVNGLRTRLGIRALGELSIPAGDVGEIAEKASQASSMKGNPVALDRGKLIEILENAWG